MITREDLATVVRAFEHLTDVVVDTGALAAYERVKAELEATAELATISTLTYTYNAIPDMHLQRHPEAAMTGECVRCGTPKADHADIDPYDAPINVCPQYKAPAPRWMTALTAALERLGNKR